MLQQAALQEQLGSQLQASPHLQPIFKDNKLRISVFFLILSVSVSTVPPSLVAQLQTDDSLVGHWVHPDSHLQFSSQAQFPIIFHLRF